MNPPAPSFVDFFAGSDLVTQGAKHACVPVWYNDICPKKAAKSFITLSRSVFLIRPRPAMAGKWGSVSKS